MRLPLAWAAASLAWVIGLGRGVVGLGDVGQFGGVDLRVFAGVVADVPPGPDACSHGADTGDDEGDAPGVEPGDQPGDDDRAKRCAQRRAAVDQGGAAATLVGGQPSAVEFGTRRHDRRLGHAQANAGDQQGDPIVGKAAQRLEGAPADGGDTNDVAHLEAVEQHTGRDLHQGIGPEERAEDQPFKCWGEFELGRNQGQGHRQRRPVDVVDRCQQQQDQEDPPAHGGRLGGVCAGRGGCGRRVRGVFHAHLTVVIVMKCRGGAALRRRRFRASSPRQVRWPKASRQCHCTKGRRNQAG
ncbi:hypothetical protein AB7M33_004543 [Pseudomonas sp. Y3 TE3536]